MPKSDGWEVKVDTSDSDEGSRRADEEMVRNARWEREDRDAADSWSSRLFTDPRTRKDNRNMADVAHRRMQRAAEAGVAYRREGQKARDLASELKKGLDDASSSRSSSKKRAPSKKR